MIPYIISMGQPIMMITRNTMVIHKHGRGTVQYQCTLFNRNSGTLAIILYLHNFRTDIVLHTKTCSPDTAPNCGRCTVIV